MTTILVIDDEPGVGKILCAGLKLAGYRAQFTIGAKAGRERFHELGPDVVVTDMHMDDIDGLELLREFRASQADVKLIAMSGDELDSADLLERARTAGADLTLIKPFLPSTLVEAIAGLVGGSGAATEHR